MWNTNVFRDNNAEVGHAATAGRNGFMGYTDVRPGNFPIISVARKYRDNKPYIELTGDSIAMYDKVYPMLCQWGHERGIDVSASTIPDLDNRRKHHTRINVQTSDMNALRVEAAGMLMMSPHMDKFIEEQEKVHGGMARAIEQLGKELTRGESYRYLGHIEEESMTSHALCETLGKYLSQHSYEVAEIFMRPLDRSNSRGNVVARAAAEAATELMDRRFLADHRQVQDLNSHISFDIFMRLQSPEISFMAKEKNGWAHSGGDVPGTDYLKRNRWDNGR